MQRKRSTELISGSYACVDTRTRTVLRHEREKQVVGIWRLLCSKPPDFRIAGSLQQQQNTLPWSGELLDVLPVTWQKQIPALREGIEQRYPHTYKVSIYSSMLAKWFHCLSFFSPSLIVSSWLLSTTSFKNPLKNSHCFTMLSVSTSNFISALFFPLEHISCGSLQ